MKNIEEIKSELNKVREDIVAGIGSIMTKNGVNIIDVSEDWGCTPVIIEDIENSEYTYTLDKMFLYDNGQISVNCSNSIDSESLWLTSISTDLLVDLYEWVVEFENEIF